MVTGSRTFDDKEEAKRFIDKFRHVIAQLFCEELVDNEEQQPTYTHTIVFNQKDAWCDASILMSWMKLTLLPFFKLHGNNALLIMDNFAGHCTEEVLRFCIKHGIHVLLLPPNTTAFMQPLDIAVNKVYKTAQKYYAHIANLIKTEIDKANDDKDFEEARINFEKTYHYVQSSIYANSKLTKISFVNGFRHMLFNGCYSSEDQLKNYPKI